MGIAAATVSSDDRLDAFEAELMAGGIATLVLERRRGGRVIAVVDADAASAPAPAPDNGVRLALGADEAVAYRRVRLTHDGEVLSRAELWYVPARLTAEMNRELARSDTPFGAVIRPLAPVRRTLSVERGAGDTVLHVCALVLDGEGLPLGEVSERYTVAALG